MIAEIRLCLLWATLHCIKRWFLRLDIDLINSILPAASDPILRGKDDSVPRAHLSGITYAAQTDSQKGATL